MTQVLAIDDADQRRRAEQRRNATTPDQTAPSLSLSRECFAKFSELITRELGIKMSTAKVSMLQSRLIRRLRDLQLRSLEEYLEYLFNSPRADEERIYFINAITTNKTDFFRERQHFDYLVGTALPNLRPRSTATSGWRLKVWCAGCSSGEEPYTLAMVLREYALQDPTLDFSILATDISTKVLGQAQLGIYAEPRIEPVPVPLRKKYLLRSRNPCRQLVRIVPELRDRITFQRLNFMDGEYGLREVFDVIFFRNVMIYFDRPTQEKVIDKQCRHLKRGGYLFVGHSESLAGLSVPVTPVAAAVFRKPL